MSRSGSHLWALFIGLLTGPAAIACPDCPTAQAVRASALSEGFWSHLLMAAVPFLLIGALSALVHRIGLPPGEMAPTRDEEEPRAEA